MTMEQQLTIGEPEASWSTTTTPGSDTIEELVRKTHPQITPFTSPGPRQMRRPIRRRLRMNERKNSGGTKMYDSIEISLVGSRSSMEGSDASPSSALTMITSATSSCTDPWSGSGGFVEEEEDEGDISWDRDDDMVKLEPIEDVDMAELADVKEENMLSETPSTGLSTSGGKRPRGRPRKHPKPSPDSMAKVAKGRSKTGCITCRKRKKKCDETKPGCKYLRDQVPLYSD